MREPKHICVLGAGFTGLAAARDLVLAGFRVTLVEKQAQAGGLAAGFELAGVPLEKGYHHIFLHDKALRNWITDLGLVDNLKWHKGSSALYLQGKLYPLNKPTDLLRLPMLKAKQKLRLAMGLGYLRWLADPAGLEKYPAGIYMRKLLGRPNYRLLFEPLLQAKFHQYKEGVNMAWLWARLDSRARTTRRGREVLGYPQGGFQSVAEAALLQFQASGGQFLPHTTVQALHQEGSQWMVETADSTIAADAVLCTLPSHVLAQLLPQADEVYRDQLSAIPYLGAVIVIIKSTQKLSDTYWHNVHDPHAPFVSFLNHTALVRDGRYGGQVYYMGAYRPHTDAQFQGTEEEVLELYLNYLVQMFPQFDRSQVSESHVFRMPNAQHVPMGRYRRILPEVQTPFTGLFLSNFSQVFPQDRGTNAAVAEGIKAAARIRHYLLS